MLFQIKHGDNHKQPAVQLLQVLKQPYRTYDEDPFFL